MQPTEVQETKMAAKEDYQRIAVVTGANKGIGFETVRQLVAAGVAVVLTARDEGRGVEATSKLHSLGLSNVVFHQLDVTDSDSINSLASFIGAKFGRLDILVNNAAASGMEVDEEGLRALNIDPVTWLSGKAANLVQGVMKTTYKKAEECFCTNYYGTKRVTGALLPWLELSSTGARIVNVSTIRGELWVTSSIPHSHHSSFRRQCSPLCHDIMIRHIVEHYRRIRVQLFRVILNLEYTAFAHILKGAKGLCRYLFMQRIPNDKIRNEFASIDSLTEEQIHELLQDFLQDVKQEALTKNEWPSMLPAYGISKTALNAYTRLLARKYPNMYINCVHPGYVDTDLNWHTGTMKVDEGAKGPVKVALLPDGGPTGCFFNQTEVAGF